MRTSTAVSDCGRAVGGTVLLPGSAWGDARIRNVTVRFVRKGLCCSGSDLALPWQRESEGVGGAGTPFCGKAFQTQDDCGCRTGGRGRDGLPDGGGVPGTRSLGNVVGAGARPGPGAL